MPALTASNGWKTLLAGVGVFELFAAEGELLSHGFDRLLERHPVWPRVVVIVFAAHLANLVPARFDAVSVGFDVIRRLFGKGDNVKT